MTPPNDSSDSEGELLRNFEEEAKLIGFKLLPAKSKEKYITCYNEFLNWKKKNKATSENEDVLLVYFHELSKTFKPSTLWCRWSMIKTMIKHHSGTNIDSFQKLKTFMKNLNKGFQAKKSAVLQYAEINRFLQDAPDDIYLGIKVILIFGIFGALRTIEICNLKLKDVKKHDSSYIVTINNTKNYYPRTFVIGEEYSEIIDRYLQMRPDKIETDRFFLSFQHGRCIRQPYGKNKITELPKTIALYLNLPNAENYTGHCFRRTSATLLADSGANLTALKQLGGWKSSTVAEGYIETSLHAKKNIYNQIIKNQTKPQPSTATNPEPSTSTAQPPIATNPRLSTIAQQPRTTTDLEPSPSKKQTKSLSPILEFDADNFDNFKFISNENLDSIEINTIAQPSKTAIKRKAMEAIENLYIPETPEIKSQKMNNTRIVATPESEHNESQPRQPDNSNFMNKIYDFNELQSIGRNIHFNNCNITTTNINYKYYNQDN